MRNYQNFVLAEIVDIKRFKTVKQLVAHAGLAPQERSLGTSVHGKVFIGKFGRGSSAMHSLCARSSLPLTHELRNKVVARE
ncbi:transposase [Ktedonobacter sp. SOSP1-85]|uniref:transposase n=1 Tax=Ktedonobacter sp. SOSP1-85 TaxID=2778367 RepID=UPI0035ADEB8C